MKNSIVAAFLFSVAITSLAKQQAGDDDYLRDAGKWLSDGYSVTHSETGQVLAHGRLQVSTHNLPGEAAAREFLKDQESVTGVPVERLRMQYITHGLGTIHVVFEEIFGSVGVYPGTAVVSFNREGIVCFFHQDLFGLKEEIDTHAAIAELNSIAIAMNDLGAGVADIMEPSAELVIWTELENPVLAWRVRTAMNQPLGDWEIFVDANNGEVLQARDLAVYEDGTGFVFRPDPLTTAEAIYGQTGYTDANDADSPQLTAEHFLDSLRGITYNGSIYTLTGPWVRIQDFESPTSPPVTATHADSFRFTRNLQGFEDANVYFHIDYSQRHIQSLGFDNIQHGQMGADPHGFNGDDNSHYLPGPNRVAFGEGGVDDAEDADVIWHEYGHGIQYSQVPNWGGGEAGAIGEGFGDYWAGSYSKSISDFRSEWVFNWDGHNPFWSGRVLNSNQHYPENLGGGIHDDGQMWSRALMDIWDVIGREVTDKIVLQSHFYLGGGATMPSNALAVIQADEDLYGGAHLIPIYTSFINRGFIDESEAPQFELLSPNGGEVLVAGDAVTIRWSTGIYDGTVSIDINFTYPSGEWSWQIAGVENVGEQVWTVPIDVTNFCRLRITADGNPSLTDQSNNCFMIRGNVGDIREKFAHATFPPTGWDVLDDGTNGMTWELKNFQFNNSAMMNFFDYTPASGQQNSLISSPLNWSASFTNGGISFASSYDWTANRYDSLKILLSQDNGATWPHQIWIDGGQTLANRPHNAIEDEPTAWRHNVISIPDELLGSENTRIAFVGINGNGDNLYLDSIEVWAGNRPPRITQQIPFTLPEIPQYIEIPFEVIAEDPEGDEISYNWYVNNIPMSSEPAFHHAFTEVSNEVVLICIVGDAIIGTAIEQAEWNIAVTPGSATDENGLIPQEFDMSVYPNPFNSTTTISYDLIRESDVFLSIHDILGREVQRLYTGKQAAGSYNASWNAAKFASGIYFVRLETGEFTLHRKVVFFEVTS